MGIAERKKREKQQRRNEIISAAKKLFFSGSYEDVTMNQIADEAELNKATLYLYFKNKEALFAELVFMGVQILKEMFLECKTENITGGEQVMRMGSAYYRFAKDYPEYLRLITFYGTERFSKEKPYGDEIGSGYGVCRLILQDAIEGGINDGSVRGDLDPFLTSMYMMISFMGVLSMEDKWRRVIEGQDYSYEYFVAEFFNFIRPTISR